MNMTPRAVLLKIGLKLLNTVRPVNTAHPKPAVHRPVNAVREKGVNLVKTSACWVWRPTKPNGASLAFKRHNYIDAQGRSNGFSRHMTGNIAYLSDFKEFDGGYVTFRGGAHGGRISGKGTLKTDSLDFEDVYFVNELKFNLFSVSQMCDKKNYVLFTDTECLVLSPNFKLPDENQILLKIPRKDNMYSFDMKNIVPKESLTCLVAKATLDESMLWHRRLGHINFKNINKLVKDNLVRGLPTKPFMKMTNLCLLVLKGSTQSFLVTDDYSRFTWVFFLTTKDETSEILKNFIKEIENLVDKKVKIIKSDNGTEFKNKVMDDFCREKGIKREYSVARTPQQNSVAERRNRTLIVAARTMLADSKLPTTFWAEAFLRLDMVEEEHAYLSFLENKPMIERTGPKWLFDIDTLTQSMNYVPVTVDTSYFDSPTKNVDNGEPKTADDAQKPVEDGLNNENAKQERFADDSNSKDVNAVGQQVNTASPDVNTGSLKLNAVGPSVSTAIPNEEDSTKEESEVDLGNIANSYIVPNTPNTRIHKDHPIDNVIGEVQSTVQTRRMLKPTSEQGFLSDVEAIQEELLQFKRSTSLDTECKKQIVVATSTTEAEYVAAASCCGQVKHVEYLMLNASPFEER
ncbi:putative ribonuclease H-like domain-containing protein [Tanacetum coccineum]